MFKKTTLFLYTLTLSFSLTFNCFAQNERLETPTAKIPKPTPEIDNEYLKKRRLETFQIVWQTINDNYFDQTFSGLNWQEIKAEYEPQVKKVATDYELHDLLQQMISRLNRSHFSIIPPEVFTAVEEAKEKATEQSRIIVEQSSIDESPLEENPPKIDEYAVYGIGLELRYFGKEFVITQIEEGSAADKANLKTGYIVEKVNGVSLREFMDSIREVSADTKSFEQKIPLQISEWFFNGEKGSYLQLTVLDEKNVSKDVLLQREKIEGDYVTILENVPQQYFIYRSKALSEDIGYIKFNYFTLPLVEKFCNSVTEFKDKKAIIIDLRGNLGGLFGGLLGISGLLIDKPIPMGTEIYKNKKEKKKINPHNKNFKGKIIILTDNVSYSAAEIFSATLQENNRATVIGETTAGEALPALTKTLPTGAILLFPISNYKTPKGNVLEGRGVKPNLQVSLSRIGLLNGKDNQLEVAIKIANEQIAKDSGIFIPRKRILKTPPPPRRSRTRKRRTRRVRKRHSLRALNVVNKFINTIGGRENLDKIRSYRGIGTIKINQSGAIIGGELEILWQAPNKYLENYRIKGVGKISEIFDGKEFIVESEFTSSNDVFPPLVLEDKSLSMGIFEVLKMRESYPRISYLGAYTVSGRRVHMIESTSPKGLKVVFLFDTKTNLLVKRTSNIMGNIEFSNYNKVVGGVLLPFKITKNSNVILNLTELQPNFAVNPESFTRKVSCFDIVD